MTLCSKRLLQIKDLNDLKDLKDLKDANGKRVGSLLSVSCAFPVPLASFRSFRSFRSFTNPLEEQSIEKNTFFKKICPFRLSFMGLRLYITGRYILKLQNQEI